MRNQAGMIYLLLLFALSTTGFLLAGLGQSWSLSAQRERETELLFIGKQFSQALASYSARSPQGTPGTPGSLDDLVQDSRFPFPVRHLREIPRDPMTGLRTWGTVTSGNRIQAIYSLSDKPVLRETAGNLQFIKPLAEARQPVRYRDWQFIAPGME